MGALIALGGVALSSRAEDRRSRNERLWNRRAEAYVDALRFLYDLGTCGPEAVTEERRSDLDARLAAFADDQVASSFKRARVPQFDGSINPESFERLVRERLADRRPLGSIRWFSRRQRHSRPHESLRYNPSFLDGGTGYGADPYEPRAWVQADSEASEENPPTQTQGRG